MDLTQLTQTLAPVLPYLLKGGIELAKSAAGELGKKLSADGWEALKRLAGKIQQKAEAKPAAADALQRAAEKPDDPRVRGMVELYLEEILKEDPDLRTEAERVLATVQASSTTVIASGNRSVAIGGSASGNVIITGDQNTVSAQKPRRPPLIEVESSMICAVRYDEENRLLEVHFNTGRIYCYEDVPPDVYQGLLDAESKGRYMRAYIIDVYSYRRGPCFRR